MYSCSQVPSGDGCVCLGDGYNQWDRVGVFMLYWENKAIHVTDGSQLLLDLIVKVVTVAEAAPAASALQKGVYFM